MQHGPDGDGFPHQLFAMGGGYHPARNSPPDPLNKNIGVQDTGIGALPDALKGRFVLTGLMSLSE